MQPWASIRERSQKLSPKASPEECVCHCLEEHSPEWSSLTSKTVEGHLFSDLACSTPPRPGWRPFHYLCPSCSLSYSLLNLRLSEHRRIIGDPHFFSGPPARYSQLSWEMSLSVLLRRQPRSSSARDTGTYGSPTSPEVLQGKASANICDMLSLPEHGPHRRTRVKTATRPTLAELRVSSNPLMLTSSLLHP